MLQWTCKKFNKALSNLTNKKNKNMKEPTMPTGVPTPEKKEEKLVLRQTKGGAYSSFPEVNDVLNEMGLAEIDKSIFLYDQTIGGAYNSKPSVEDVYNLLHGNLRSWQESEQGAMDNGHGEYVGNVEAAVEFCKQNNISEVGDIQKMLDNAQQDISWREDAHSRGHGEYVSNVEAAAEYCKSKGAKSHEDVERLLKEAEIEER
jgi:hypothetical protein